jgi:hypothetical protein
MECCAHAALCAVTLRIRFQNDMVVARHGRNMGVAWHV